MSPRNETVKTEDVAAKAGGDLEDLKAAVDRLRDDLVLLKDRLGEVGVQTGRRCPRRCRGAARRAAP